MAKSYHTSAGIFHTNGQAKFEMKFFENSDSKHYIIRPDIFEYDRLERLVFDLILGVKTMKKLGIVLDFETSQIQIDHISLPMRDNFKLQERSKIKKAWAVNNSIMRDEPESTKELTNREKADLPEIVETQCRHLDAHQRKELLDLLLEFKDLFDGTLLDMAEQSLHSYLMYPREGIFCNWHVRTNGQMPSS
jgi:hypothetical protein